MTNNKQSERPIIEKFRKKDRICNICEQEQDLTIDHVPPQGCPLAKSIVISQLLCQMTNDKSFRPRISQNGVTYKTICSNCNNSLGTRYDGALVDFSLKIESFVQSNLILPSSFNVQCQPNAIMRSVLGHLLAAKTKIDPGIVDTLIRPCVLDQSLPIPDDIHIFYWVYPYEKIVILRDFGMPAVRGQLHTSGFFSLIKFYPIAFLVTHDLSSYEKLATLHEFNKLSPNNKVSIPINLLSIKSPTWPEECIGLENFLMLSESSNDSVYAVPKAKKTKSNNSRNHI